MSTPATLPIERRFRGVLRTGRGVQAAGRSGNPGRIHPFRVEQRAVGTELRSLEEGAEGARDRQTQPSL
jgi:hypothetical protein